MGWRRVVKQRAQNFFHPMPDRARPFVNHRPNFLEKFYEDAFLGVRLNDLFARHAPDVFALMNGLIDNLVQARRARSCGLSPAGRGIRYAAEAGDIEKPPEENDGGRGFEHAIDERFELRFQVLADSSDSP